MTSISPDLHPDRSAVDAGIVVGLGARATAGVAEILSLVDEQLRAAGRTRADIALCITLDRKTALPALRQAAQALSVPLLGCDEASLSAHAPTPSPVVWQHAGVVSVAEAAAASLGPLLAPKRKSANATCALALFQVPPVMAANAASMVSTSRAGP